MRAVDSSLFWGLLALLASNCIDAQVIDDQVKRFMFMDSTCLIRLKTLEGCGTEYGCFSGPTGCANEQTLDASNCIFVHKFKSNAKDPNLVDFVLTAKVNNPSNTWLAVGFSYVPKMVLTSNYTVCSSKYFRANFRNKPNQGKLEHRHVQIQGEHWGQCC